MTCLETTAAALTAISLWALVPAQDPAPHEAPERPALEAADTPGKPAKLGNMWAVSATAQVLFTASPTPHSLEMTYAFPARARWCVRPEPRRGNERHQIYRYGATLHGWNSGQPASRVLLEPERVQTLRQLELMRATLLWPDGFAWKETANGHIADLGVTGKLFTPKHDGERPEAFYMLAPDGAVGDSTHVAEWSRQNERWWPAKWHMESGGEVTSRLEMERIDTAMRVHDSFFTPPDRRAVGQARLVKTREQIDLDARAVRRIPLESAGEWDAAAAEAEKLRAHWLADVPGLVPWTTLEVDARGRPRALWLELEAGLAPPDGWTLRQETPALRVVVENRSDVTGSLLRDMRKGLEKGAKTGPALVRLQGGQRLLQVVLPLVGS